MLAYELKYLNFVNKIHVRLMMEILIFHSLNQNKYFKKNILKENSYEPISLNFQRTCVPQSSEMFFKIPISGNKI